MLIFAATDLAACGKALSVAAKSTRRSRASSTDTGGNLTSLTLHCGSRVSCLKKVTRHEACATRYPCFKNWYVIKVTALKNPRYTRGDSINAYVPWPGLMHWCHVGIAAGAVEHHLFL